MNINIFDLNLNQIATVQNFETLEWQRSFYGVGKFTITLNFFAKYANELQENRIIVINNDVKRAGIIESFEFDESQKSMLKIKGRELKGIFSSRITIPPAAQSHQSFSAIEAETVIKDIVQQQCIDTIGMEIPQINITTDEARGILLTLKTRYKQLDLELEKIGKISQLGHILKPNFSTKKWDFDILETTDKSTDVFFSDKFGNLSKTKYVKDNFNSYNYAVIGGTGEGAARVIEETGTVLTGIEKKVMFVDARDLTTTDDLVSRGEQKLSLLQPSESFDCMIQNRIFLYETDWDLGDIVKVQNSKIEKEATFQIENITEFYVANKDVQYNVTFGKRQQTAKEYIDESNNIGIV